MNEQIGYVFNVLIVGDKKVGKTTYLDRIKTGNFRREYIPTINKINVYWTPYSHIAETDGMKNIVNFNICEYAGDKYIGMFNGVYNNIDAVILMFDKNNIPSFESINSWITVLKQFIPTNKIIIVGSKTDSLNFAATQIRKKRNTYIRKKLNTYIREKLNKLSMINNYIEISTKSCYQLYKPLHNITQILLNKL